MNTPPQHSSAPLRCPLDSPNPKFPTRRSLAFPTPDFKTFPDLPVCFLLSRPGCFFLPFFDGPTPRSAPPWHLSPPVPALPGSPRRRCAARATMAKPLSSFPPPPHRPPRRLHLPLTFRQNGAAQYAIERPVARVNLLEGPISGCRAGEHTLQPPGKGLDLLHFGERPPGPDSCKDYIWLGNILADFRLRETNNRRQLPAGKVMLPPKNLS